MKSAEQLVHESIPFVSSLFSHEVNQITALVRNAQIDAIKACAEAARETSMKIQEDCEMSLPQTYYPEVAQQTILKIIEQVK